MLNQSAIAKTIPYMKDPEDVKQALALLKALPMVPLEISSSVESSADSEIAPEDYFDAYPSNQSSSSLDPVPVQRTNMLQPRPLGKQPSAFPASHALQPSAVPASRASLQPSAIPASRASLQPLAIPAPQVLEVPQANFEEDSSDSDLLMLTYSTKRRGKARKQPK